MSIISLEQQRQFGQRLRNLRKNISGDAEGTGEEKEPVRLRTGGLAGFIALGGLALLKDIFDFVFFSMAFFRSTALAVAYWADWGLTAAGALLMIPEPTFATKVAGIIVGILSAIVAGVSHVASAGEAATQSAGIILPFLFTTMFMVVVVAVLLLSGMGLKSYKIFLNARTIAASFFSFTAEIIPGLNILPWTVIYVVILYFIVKKELKKKHSQAEPA